MEESKSKQNYLKETGYGQLFGCFQNITNMVNGLQVERSILWKVEVMLIIQRNSVEDLKLLVLHFIGVQITSQTNFPKLMLKSQFKVV